MKQSLFAIMLASALGLTSCLGSFTAFNNLKDWNLEVTDSEWANEAIFLGLNIIPVYALFFLGDVLIFNSVEFWTGENPLAMNDEDKDIQLVEKDGKSYRITATKNQYLIEQLGDGGEIVDTGILKYVPKKGVWKAKRAGKSMDVLQFSPDGERVTLLPGTEHATEIMTGQDLCEVREALMMKQIAVAAK